MNLPNQLTVSRLALSVVFVACLSVQFPFNHTLALALFLIASFTDYLDGVIARRGGLITDFGKLMDPLADKILTAAAFICLIPYGALPAWVVIVIIAREFLITGLRLLAGAKGVVLPAENLGKHKTAWQMATIIFFLLLLALGDWNSSRLAWTPFAWNAVGPVMVAVTTLLTVYSGAGYFWKNRALITSA
ncbi:MAG: CDP-diacylglycerol--glycerol-3-phosphate 3-phosphatidyltransferase [Terrimicrobiaceae bacterium]|nr:CDP-diacylglycerol--glycerol-3-phosphate 3-phosphatidyltransferase [Terrimicrobiaceae bacterium]